MNSFSTYGMITKKGNLTIYNRQRLDQYLHENKEYKIIIEIHTISNDRSERMFAYYSKVLVPAFQKAFNKQGTRYTLKETEQKMREMCPIMYKESMMKNGTWEQELKTVNDIDNSDFIYYLEHLKQIGAEDFDIFIEDPKLI